MSKLRIRTLKLKRVVPISFLFILLLLIFCFVLPESYIPWRIRTNVKHVKDFISFVWEVSPLNVGWCSCSSDEEITIMRRDSLKIAGSLYATKDKTKRPGIILFHGNTPVGRKLAIYKILAEKLSRKGYIVLTIDFTGFGESDDPFSLGTIEALDRDLDAYAAIDFLKTLQIIDTSQIYLIGHSGGAGPAFNVGVKEPIVKGIIAIGPPRRVSERFHNLHDKNYFWKRAIGTRQEIYGKEFPTWYTEDMWVEGILRHNLKKYIHYFSQNWHKPLFLIDGELESEKDKLYLRNFFNEITEPKKYITLAHADHYCNTMAFLSFAFYDKKTITQVINEIDRWIIRQKGMIDSTPLD